MRLTAWWSLCLVGLMTASGGGGGGDLKVSNDGGTVSSAGQEVSTVSGDCAYLGSFFSELLSLTNQAREEAGLKPLRSSYQLGQSAQVYAEDLATQNFFSHQGKDGSTLSTRVAATGYDFAAAGENIAAGQRSASTVFRGWMNSDGHRKNILEETYTEVGFGLFDATGSSDYGKYWVQNFGKPSGDSSQEGVYIPSRCGVGVAEAAVEGETKVAGISVKKTTAIDGWSFPDQVAVNTLATISQRPFQDSFQDGSLQNTLLAAALLNQISAAAVSGSVPEPALAIGLATFGWAVWGVGKVSSEKNQRR